MLTVVFETPHFFPRAQPWWVRWYRETNACHISTERTYSHLSDMLPDCPGETDCLSKELEKEEEEARESTSGQYICQLSCKERHITGNLCYFFVNTTLLVSYFTGTFKNNLKVTVTRDDSQRWFSAPHSVARLEQGCNYSKQCRNAVLR